MPTDSLTKSHPEAFGVSVTEAERLE